MGLVGFDSAKLFLLKPVGMLIIVGTLKKNLWASYELVKSVTLYEGIAGSL